MYQILRFGTFFYLDKTEYTKNQGKLAISANSLLNLENAAGNTMKR
jgi:hypothetical protein